MLIKSKSDRPGKLRKLDARAHIDFLVGYESTNIYRIWIPHKRKVISAKDVIFNEDEVWDQKPIRLSPAEIQELDEAVEVVEIPQTDEQEEIQLTKDSGLDLTNPDPITQQNDHEMENLEEAEQAERDKLTWSQGQYPTPDLSEPEFARETAEINTFLTNLVENQRTTFKQAHSEGSAESSDLVFIADFAESADSAESERVRSNQTSQPHHSQSHSQPHGELYSEPYPNPFNEEPYEESFIDPSILNELQNQHD